MSKSKRNSVLIVDDERTNIIALTGILESEYEIYAASDGLDAVELAESFLPDIILLDIIMPEMDGYATIAALKKSEKTKDIPVIFLTGMTDSENEIKGLKCGAVDYIFKPFSRELLLKRVELHLLMEEQRRELKRSAERAAAVSKAKGDFLSMMSHEMRAPMNAIIGMTAIGKKAESKEGKHDALNKIGDASTFLLGVINDVLDMAKIEANRLELSPVEFDFEKMLQKIITVMNFRVDEKKQTLTLNIDNKIPRVIVGDDQRLMQIITNLLSNAVKFTPENGKIHLEASLAGEDGINCELRIDVTDSGIGLSPEQQEKLFQEFEQAESGTSRKFGGTGLGLAISKRIVELMDGKIWVESELGKGARFIFTVKVLRGAKSKDDAEREDETNAEIAGAFKGKKLLIAEDAEINREILVSLLEDTGLIIDCAGNGKEALEMIEASPDKYDIVFMDIQMPEMDGREATRRIRALPCVAHGRKIKLPVIAMTGCVFAEDIEACRAAGMDDHLNKPIDIDEVIKILRKYL